MVKNPKRKTLHNTDQKPTKKPKNIQQNTSNNNKNRGKRMMVKLYFPKLFKFGEIMTWGDQRLDLGSISTMFGIEPATLRLNGHFISRGVDLIASSVTWDSLVSFFSSKALSTGVVDSSSSSALIVDGKLSNIGTKRAHEPPEVGQVVNCCTCLRQCAGDCSPLSKKLKNDGNVQSIACYAGLKRRPWVDQTSLFKKARVSGSYTHGNSQDCLAGGGVSEGCYIRRLHCGYQMNENMKRLRDKDVTVAASCKKTR